MNPTLLASLTQSLPGILVIVGSFIVCAMGGVFAMINITSRKIKASKQESDDLQTKIRALYKEESLAQDEKIKNQSGELTDLRSRMMSIEAENRMMKDILLGRDQTSLEYRKRVEATLTLVDKLSEIITINGTKTDAIMAEVQSVNRNIETLAAAIAKQKK